MENILLFSTGLRCSGCNAAFSTSEKIIVCRDCGKVLDVEYDLSKIKENFKKDELNWRERSLWRYREFLPIGKEDCIVSLGEGLTP